MNLSLRSTRLLLLGGLAIAGLAQAQQGPVVNIGERHGNLRAAQEHIVQAYQLVSQAQTANDARLGGHAGRAKELLAQADAELRQAASVANEHGF
ncbi:MAG TPA: hypothetical protein VGC74_01750 [Stenotrophomonas sp.]|jgi:hypothetical protein